MVDSIGRSGGSLAQEAIQAALRRQTTAHASVEQAVADVAASAAGAQPAQVNPAQDASGSFVHALRSGTAEVVKSVHASEKLPVAMVEGTVTDFHEIAAQIKTADLSFKFALEVRNKLIDAYREVMRMSV